MKTKLLISILLLFIYSSTVKAWVYVDKAMKENSVTYTLKYCLPNNFDASKEYPLIVAMHYCGGSAEQYRSALSALSDSLKMIVVCPDNKSQQIPESQAHMLVTAIDSSNIFYRIDTTKVYLTGMSCNGEFITRHGLNNIYPFKGIFPWDPWITTTNPKVYNYNCKIPIVMSVGSFDPNFATIVAFYDSLKAHNAEANLLIVPSVAHDLFPSFSVEMINCIYYLNGTPDFSFEPIKNIEIPNNDSVYIDVIVKNPGDKKLKLSATVNSKSLVTKTEITPGDKANQYKLKIVPNQLRKGNLIVTVKAFDEISKEMTQEILNVKIAFGLSTPILKNQNEFNIYPVPVNDFVYFKSKEQNLTINITDATGKEMINFENVDTRKGLQLQSLPKGFYFLSAKGAETNETIKFLKL